MLVDLIQSAVEEKTTTSFCMGVADSRWKKKQPAPKTPSDCSILLTSGTRSTSAEYIEIKHVHNIPQLIR